MVSCGFGVIGSFPNLPGIASILACHLGVLPPTLNLEEVDAEFASSIDHVTGEFRPWAVERRIALNNSFGFGGTNACVCFGNYVP